ncbi:acyl-CoA thioesterase [Rhodocyclus purpureus]|uniref:acyl-CoA thioesterase n=1 Tax=Rhodocyclus purpureus TaxID=1067 RepID=UPI0019142500|nr:thioesterase family protein [Rhodocyclus purpureus]MBK5913917.1 thioesterase [Rhodocyclus purpureus]
MVFTKKKNVRFSHCDPAGIVFYPRYAELCNELVEDWFREALGVDFHQFQEKLRLSVPAVRLNVEFLQPSTYGEVLEFALHVTELGNSSLSLSVIAWCGEQERVRIQLKLVMISLDTMRSVKIDDEWRAKFSAFLE